ncbi:PREDICTED: growth/differentiation factor 8-like [Branchiostoma belcheri]|uniref:Growth/differentiation factor 8-like n=2 Tax=Branchiostoma TaxID=7737 RepID=A0A6P4ZEK8_BRABE|nr:PREDICTED: growth/differentiation factor 8-like [Branchiostoma belcheri]
MFFHQTLVYTILPLVYCMHMHANDVDIEVLQWTTGEEANVNSTRERPSGSSVDAPPTTGYREEATPPGPAETSKCGAACTRGQEREMRVETLKKHILDKLGLKRSPTIPRNRTLPSAPPMQSLLDQYGFYPDRSGNIVSGEDITQAFQGDSPASYNYHLVDTERRHYEDVAETETVITVATPPPVAPFNESGCCFFKFGRHVSRTKVNKAFLWLYVRAAENMQSTSIPLKIYRIAPASSFYTEPYKILISSHKITDVKPNEGLWVSYPIRDQVRRWFHNPAENLGIVIETSEAGKDLIVLDPKPGEEPMQPFLVMHTHDPGTVRRKRMAGLNCEQDSNEERCCRYPLQVDFREFGWDWIIAPNTYQAYYCAGDCPPIFLQKYPHTHLVQQVNKAGSVGPCCTPTKMSNISMLYFDDDGNIIYAKLPDMKVDRCGCS